MGKVGTWFSKHGSLIVNVLIVWAALATIFPSVFGEKGLRSASSVLVNVLLSSITAAILTQTSIIFVSYTVFTTMKYLGGDLLRVVDAVTELGLAREKHAARIAELERRLGEDR